MKQDSVADNSIISSTSSMRKGLLWAALCSGMFSLLPFFSQQALKQFSAMDVAWFRLSFAAFCLYLWLVIKGDFKLQIVANSLKSVLLAGLLLAINFVGYTKGVELSGAANAQMVIQIAQLSLVLIGIFLLKERVSALQCLGLVLAFLGLYFFVSERSGSSVDSKVYAVANWHLVISAISWGAYAAIQKVVTRTGSIQLFNCFILITASLVVLPLVAFENFRDIFTLATLMLIGVALVSLIAYIALAEALAYASATLVSAVIVLNPIGTIALLYLFSLIGFSVSSSELLGMKGLLSALMAVLGVIFVVAAKPSSNASKI